MKKTIATRFIGITAVLMLVLMTASAIVTIWTTSRSQAKQAEAFFIILESEKSRQTQVLKAALQKKGEALTRLLVQSAGSLIANFNFEVLAQLAQNGAKDPDIAFVCFYNAQGEPLTATIDPMAGVQVIRQDIMLNGSKVGEVAVGINYSTIEASMRQVADHIQNSIEEVTRVTRAEQFFVIKLVLFIAICSIVVFCAVVFWLLVAVVLRPISKVMDFAGKISQGDLLARIPGDRQDEIGRMSVDLNLAVDNLKSIVERLIQTIQSLSGNSQMLNATAESLTAKAAEIREKSDQATQNTDMVAQKTRNMATAAEEVSVQVANVAEASNDVAANMKIIGQGAGDVSNSVNTVAASIEEMYASLNEVAKSSSRGASVTNEAADMADATSTIVNDLGLAAKEIGDVVDLIKGIAAQTNLLALNAAIEAASAGDAGKGFAVVANEVKELARQTGGATEDIRRKVEGMQVNTNSAIKAIESIFKVITEINTIMGTIAASVEQQTATTTEISKNTSNTALAAHSVSASVQEAIQAGQNVSQTIDEVARAAEHIARDANEACEGTDQMTRSVKDVFATIEATSQDALRIRSQSEDLERLAAELQAVVGQFKIVEKNAPPASSPRLPETRR